MRLLRPTMKPLQPFSYIKFANQPKSYTLFFFLNFTFSMVRPLLSVCQSEKKTTLFQLCLFYSFLCSITPSSSTVSLNAPPTLHPTFLSPLSSSGPLRQPWGPDPMSEAACWYQSSPQSMSACIIREVNPAILFGKTSVVLLFPRPSITSLPACCTRLNASVSWL